MSPSWPGPGPGPPKPPLGRLLARPASVRGRATLVASAVVAVALVVGALGLVRLLRVSLEEGVESSARIEASTIAGLARRGLLPRVLPIGRGDLMAVVVSRDGRVLATTPDVVRPMPLSPFPPAGSVAVRRVGALAVGELDVPAAGPSDQAEGPFLIVSSQIPTAQTSTGRASPAAVEVAASLAQSGQVVGDVEVALAAGVPALVALVAAIVFVLTRRALAPVERIRHEVADITLTDLHRRVPEPASGDEVARLARTMNAMLDRLESSAVRQRRFVADASHELRTPLATVEASLEISLAHPETLPWASAAASALSGTKRLSRIVEELLLLARSDEGRLLRGDLGLVDLDELVLAETSFAPPPPGVRLSLARLSAGRVLGDAEALSRVVRNLLDNAYRHAAGEVAVDVSTEGDDVVLVVADDGPGIPEHAQELVFERFARLDDDRGRDRGGAGLGLALVREIVVAHGGSVAVAKARVGARLVVVLPRAHD